MTGTLPPHWRDWDLNHLTEEIRRHDRLYWKDGEPEIPDTDYDRLVRRLAELAPGHELLTKVHAPAVAASGKVRHAKAMLSLDKAYSIEEVLTWAGKYARDDGELFLIQPKYDGISANFADGVLATRGDGVTGENVSDKIPLIELESPGYRGPLDRPVRGEIVIRDDDFQKLYAKITKKDGKPYKNSRNAVAGIMGLKNIEEMVRQQAKLTIIDYEMVCERVKMADLEKKWNSICEAMTTLPYPTDGLVVKLADAAYAESLGETAHHPRGQIAFKFTNASAKTKLLDIEWSFGKNCLTPVAVLEPVDLSGVTIRHATLHNAQNIIDKDIMIGDTVVVERAGDVIPYIASSEPAAERRSGLIELCPCCETPLIRRGPELICPNRECPETRLQRLLAAVRNIGIERLGEPNLRRMTRDLGVKSLRDIFALSIPEIMRLEGFREKSAGNLYREIQKARSVNDYQVLAALNIPNIGQSVAKKILAEHPLEELRGLDIEALSLIPTIGPERASALKRELNEQSEILDELLDCVNVSSTKGGVGRPTICFTGKMPEKRSHYEKLAEEHGFEPVGQVSASLSLLVAVDPDGGGSKLEKAAKAGVKVVALDDWLAMLGSAGEPEINAEIPAQPELF